MDIRQKEISELTWFYIQNLRTRGGSTLHRVMQQLEPRFSNFPQAACISIKVGKECPYLWEWLETKQKKNGKVIKHLLRLSIFLPLFLPAIDLEHDWSLSWSLYLIYMSVAICRADLVSPLGCQLLTLPPWEASASFCVLAGLSHRGCQKRGH